MMKTKQISSFLMLAGLAVFMCTSCENQNMKKNQPAKKQESSKDSKPAQKKSSY